MASGVVASEWSDACDLSGAIEAAVLEEPAGDIGEEVGHSIVIEGPIEQKRACRA